MNNFTLVFLLMLFATSAFQFWLSRRHSQHIMRHKHQVPEMFSDKVSLAEHQHAAEYNKSKAKLFRIELILSAILALIWTVGGGLSWLSGTWSNFSDNALIQGGAQLITFTVISSVISIPLGLYSTFSIEQKFGFNRTTLKTYLIDQVKGLALGLIIGLPLAIAILWLMDYAGPYWWIWAWALLSAFSITLMWAFPKFIAPLFNEFKPLEDAELETRISALLNKAGFESNGVFVMDGSKRSSHGNAYFSGFGKNKRIVFFDTLLNQLSATEIEAVLAHELGHFKHKHIIQSIFISLGSSLIGLAALAYLMKQAWFYDAFAVNNPSTAMALVLFLLISGVFTYFLTPVFSWFSRKNEFEADSFAAETTDARELINALVGLYKKNAGTLTPDPLHSAFYDSHPPASIRINYLLQEQEKLSN